MNVGLSRQIAINQSWMKRYTLYIKSLYLLGGSVCKLSNQHIRLWIPFPYLPIKTAYQTLSSFHSQTLETLIIIKRKTEQVERVVGGEKHEVLQVFSLF